VVTMLHSDVLGVGLTLFFTTGFLLLMVKLFRKDDYPEWNAGFLDGAFNVSICVIIIFFVSGFF